MIINNENYQIDLENFHPSRYFTAANNTFLETKRNRNMSAFYRLQHWETIPPSQIAQVTVFS